MRTVEVEIEVGAGDTWECSEPACDKTAVGSLVIGGLNRALCTWDLIYHLAMFNVGSEPDEPPPGEPWYGSENR